MRANYKKALRKAGIKVEKVKKITEAQKVKQHGRF